VAMSQAKTCGEFMRLRNFLQRLNKPIALHESELLTTAILALCFNRYLVSRPYMTVLILVE